LASAGCSLQPEPHIRKIVEEAVRPRGDGSKGLPETDALALVRQWVAEGMKAPASVPSAILDIKNSENWVRDDICLIGENGRYVFKNPDGSWDYRTFYTDKATKSLLVQEHALDPNEAEAVLESSAHPVVRKTGVIASKRALVPTEDGLMLNTNPQGYVEPQEGDWSDIRAYLACQVGEENLEWVLNWAALCAQNPTRRPGTAVVITGPQGTGKTESGKWVGYCRGAWVEVGHSDVTSGFNAHWAGAPFILASELIIGEEAAKHGQNLKRYITDETVQRRIKFGSEAPVANQSAWWITSNKKNPVPVERTDRRYAVFQSKMPPDELNRRIKKELDAYPDQRRSEWPQLRAFRYYLLNRDVDQDWARVIPDTNAHRDMKQLGMSSAEKFEAEVNAEGLKALEDRLSASVPGGRERSWNYLPSAINYDEGWAATDALKALYSAWCHLERLPPMSGERFIQEISWPTLEQKKRLKDGRQVRVRVVPMCPAEDREKAA
jgi:hypothetical protein